MAPFVCILLTCSQICVGPMGRLNRLGEAATWPFMSYSAQDPAFLSLLKSASHARRIGSQRTATEQRLAPND
jgi:hypothetical protein